MSYFSRRQKKFRLAPILILAAPLFLSASGAVQAKAPDLILIGLDGASWNVIEPLLKKGQLPQIKSLRDRGAYGVLLSTHPMRSPALWTTIATGKPFQEHGINDFFDGERRMTSGDRKVKALWNILADKNRRAAIIGYMATWPAEPISGVMITDQALNPYTSEGKFFPADFPTEYGPLRAWDGKGLEAIRRLDRFLPSSRRPWKWTPNDQLLPTDSRQKKYRFLVDRRLRTIYLRDESFTRAAEWLLKTKQPEVLAIHIWGLDYTSHGFWKYAFPDGRASNEDQRALGKIVPEYYRYADEIVGRLSRFADEHTVILVISDHGFEAWTPPSDDPYPFLSGNHALEGIVVAQGGPIKKEARATGATIFDVTPTALYLLGLATADDMPGRIWTDIIDPKWMEAHPVERIASYGDMPQRTHRVSVAMDAEEKALLRQLGYLK